jgi:fimbrial isopeptide formation D2 family protein
VFKNIENASVFNLADPGDSFTWHVVAAFSGTTSTWGSVAISDILDPALSLEDVAIVDSAGNVVSDYDYSLDAATNTVLIELRPDAAGASDFGYLANMTYTVSLRTSIHSDVSASRLAELSAAGGISNQASLDIDGGVALSETPRVVYSPNATSYTSDTSDAAAVAATQSAGSQSGTPNTGNRAEFWFAAAAILAAAGTMTIRASRTKHPSKSTR